MKKKPYAQYVKNMPLKNETAQSKNYHRWLDRGTRALIIEFMMFNPTTQLFNSVEMVFESPATGGLNHYSRYEFKLRNHKNDC